MTTDLSRVYTIRKADIIAVFLEAFSWQSQQEEACEEPQGAVLSIRLKHLRFITGEKKKTRIQSLASPTPSALIANMASASGRQGES